MEKVDLTIIGAGVIGLAIARETARRFETVLLVEKHPAFGQETSSRSSEVIHAGLYYRPGSLKARLCREGADLLYRYCREFSVPHRATGKLVAAADETELAGLEEVFRRARENGVPALELLDRRALRRREPSVRGAGALFSPRTGIIDSHALMAALFREARGGGVLPLFGTEVTGLDKLGGGFLVAAGENGPRFLSRLVVNAAGLGADRLARAAGIDPDRAGYRQRWCKGSYFAYRGPSPVATLVYPLPERNLVGLGVHATLDLAGKLRFGPDTEPVDEIDYRVDENRAAAFHAAAARLIGGLDREKFAPDTAGIRPRLQGEGETDFVIREESGRGLPGLVTLAGMESPGLTACLAIARLVTALLRAPA